MAAVPVNKKKPLVTPMPSFYFSVVIKNSN